MSLVLKPLRVGIDASGIKSGGGLAHLLEVLAASNPAAHGVTEIVVWCGRTVAERAHSRPGISIVHVPELDRSLWVRARWQSKQSAQEARNRGIDVLFVPAGSTFTSFQPVVCMSQNMLPFEPREMMRYGLSRVTLRLAILRFFQARCALRSAGFVFLTDYARTTFQRAVGRLPRRTMIVPHGVNPRFRMAPRPTKALSEYSSSRPFRLLYVSIVDLYKHQWHVVSAVARLRRAGRPVILDLVGPAYRPALRRLQKVIDQEDPDGEFVRYRGPIPFTELHHAYAEADIGIFASSCENQPIILLEGMAAGLPIACSQRGPMPEVLGRAGMMFDPENVASIADAIDRLLHDPELRFRLALQAYRRTDGFTWQRTADQTLEFLAQVAREP